MIRECTAEDSTLLEEYLGDESYGRTVLSLIKQYGFDHSFQSIYADIEEDRCKGVYLCIHKNLLLYCKENQVDIDFLENLISMLVPEMVAGRKDNVNIVSWLLTDYRQDTVNKIPELCDEEGNPVERAVVSVEDSAEEAEWGVLLRDVQ